MVHDPTHSIRCFVGVELVVVCSLKLLDKYSPSDEDMPAEELGDFEDAALVLHSSVSTSTSRPHYKGTDLVVTTLKNIGSADDKLQSTDIGQKREIARQ